MDNRPFFIRTPKWQIVIVMVLGLLLYSFLNWRLGGSAKNQTAILIDFVLFFTGIAGSIFFFAQFVLPANRLRERFMVFMRLLRYLTGEHGPALRVENGEVNAREESERSRPGPGIIILDTASGALLRTDKGPSRPVGPGIVFTAGPTTRRFLGPIIRSSEELQRAVDLRIYSESLGPGADQNPFAGAPDSPDRRTRGLTRDGIEVFSTIRVNFRLNANAREGHTEFGYRPQSVWRATTREGLDPYFSPQQENTQDRYQWVQIPCYLATDIWRETLGLFDLDDLFTILPPRFYLSRTNGRRFTPHRVTGLEFINRRILQRLTQPNVDLLDEIGRTNDFIPSREYNLLQIHGIHIIRARITHLWLPNPIEEQLVRRWEAAWLENTRVERDRLSQASNKVMDEAKDSIHINFASTAARPVVEQFPVGIRNQNADILRTLLESTLQLCQENEVRRQRTMAERNALQEIMTWLNRQV